MPAQTTSTTDEPKNVASRFPLNINQVLIILLLSGIMGMLADYLFQVFPSGLNVSLYGIILVAGLYFIPEYAQLKTKPNPLLLICLAVLVILFSWRASIFLQSLNLAVQIFLLLLIAAQLSQQHLLKTHPVELILNLTRTGFGFIISPFRVIFESPWKELNKLGQNKNSQILFASIRGLIFAVPLIIIFALLFASADAVFENLLQRSFNIDIENFVERLFTTGFLSALAFAYLSQSFLPQNWSEINNETPNILQFGKIETSVVFGSLSLLFLSFILVQASYLFGGESLVLDSSLSYAEYGRRGFFELVTVTLLLHFVLLLGLWFTANKEATGLYRVFASILVILLYGVIISAFSRLNLYIDTFGLTELRFYSSAMIIWIAVIMLYFLYRLHSLKAPKLIPSYLVLGMLGVIGLYLSNPDATITRVNLNRINTAIELDVNYLEQLSLDAMPIIVKHLENMPEADLKIGEIRDLKNLLEYKASQDRNTDWRGFNIGRWLAYRALEPYSQKEISGWIMN